MNSHQNLGRHVKTRNSVSVDKGVDDACRGFSENSLVVSNDPRDRSCTVGDEVVLVAIPR